MNSAIALVAPYNAEGVLFDEIVKTSKIYLRGCSLLDRDWLNEVAPLYFAGNGGGGGGVGGAV